MSDATAPAFADLMVDLETVGTEADSPIVQLAAVRFDPLAGLFPIGDDGAAHYYRGVHLESPGQGPIDSATLLWWLGQNAEARTRVFLMDAGGGCPPRLPLREALVGLVAFMRTTGISRVWANAPTFDLAILRSAAKRCGVQALSEALPFYNERCFRTLRALGKDLGIKAPTAPVAHDALADARAQALHAVEIMRALRTVRVPA